MKGAVLIADDDPANRKTFEEILRDAEYYAVSVADCDGAVKLFDERPFDVVFADIWAGDCNGIDLLREIRKRTPSCQVVIIAAQHNFVQASEAIRMNVFDYVPRPVTKPMLLRIADQALRHKKAVDAREGYRATLEATFKCVCDAILTIDLQYKILAVNDAIGQFVPAAPEDLIGRPLKDAIGPALLDTLTDAARKTIASGQLIKEYPAELACPDGRRQTVLINSTPLADPRSVRSGVVLVLRDITRIIDLERETQERRSFRNMIGKSKPMQEIYHMIEALADTDTTVLVTGESGTGKELVADALHGIGPRSAGPLIKINCSALAENLLESELFGHVKGAFTGAIKDKIGRFELADGGTIFLDEIGDLNPPLQVKLLRFLQQREFERVGDTRPIKVNVRVIAATHQNLSEKAQRGLFREDLYYRLKVVEVPLPPLRNRKGDIPLIVDHLRQRYNTQLRKNIVHIDEEVYKAFLAYDWPGNIRELEHAMEHAFIVCSGSEITTAHLPAEIISSVYRENAPQRLSKASRSSEDAVRAALEKSGWNKAKAARILGIGRQTLYRKIQEYNIAEPGNS